MTEITLNGYAKINLTLDITGTREDGYHLLRMIMQTIDLYDRLQLRITRSKDITLKTNLAFLPSNENNLVYKAIDLFRRTYGIEDGVYASLDKKIPVAAGLAGGSTDAAAALIGMNTLFHIDAPSEDLSALAVKLGADVPYCLLGGTALAEGIGEKLTVLPAMPECHLVLVKPQISVSTPHVYKEYDQLPPERVPAHPDTDGAIEAINNHDLYGVTNRLSNVLEAVTIAEYPYLSDIKKGMLEFGALGALMSGSGPSVFGLFDDEQKAHDAFYHFKCSEYGRYTYLTKLKN